MKRTFHNVTLIYKLQPAGHLPLHPPRFDWILNTLHMNQPSFDTQLGAPLLINKIVERLTLSEGGLAEVKRSLDEVNHKVDSLLVQSTATCAPGFNTLAPGDIATSDVSSPAFIFTPRRSPFNPSITPDSERMLWQRYPSDFEGFNSLGGFP